MILEQTPTRLLILITDIGKGIPTDQQDRIFEWFRKVETSDATQYEGSGLGLAISKGFCDLVGGTISVESRVDVGSIFTVVIPLPAHPSLYRTSVLRRVIFAATALCSALRVAIACARLRDIKRAPNTRIMNRLCPLFRQLFTYFTEIIFGNRNG